jgi:hypothetical protein
MIADADGIHHFVEGESSAERQLNPGTHSICAQIADADHIALYGTDEIIVDVMG